jgi:hypothetical protein
MQLRAQAAVVGGELLGLRVEAPQSGGGTVECLPLGRVGGLPKLGRLLAEAEALERGNHAVTAALEPGRLQGSMAEAG